MVFAVGGWNKKSGDLSSRNRPATRLASRPARWRLKFRRTMLPWQEAIQWVSLFLVISFLIILYMNVRVRGNLLERKYTKKQEVREELLKVNQVLREALQTQAREVRNYDFGSGFIVSPLAKNQIVEIPLPVKKKPADSSKP